MPINLQNMFAAIAFAEENEHNTALNLLYDQPKESSIWKTLGMKLGRFRKAVDKYQEQITFAEAGSFELINECEAPMEEVRINKLLVVGNEASFSRDVINYAIEMAKRMSYDILALNTAPFSCNTISLFSSHQRELCNDFKKLASENVSEFKEKALEKGLNFKHIIMFDTLDEAQENVFKEYKDISFVISNVIEDRATNDKQREDLSNRIFVYSMV